MESSIRECNNDVSISRTVITPDNIDFQIICAKESDVSDTETMTPEDTGYKYHIFK